VTERAEIATIELGAADFEPRFERLYPTTYARLKAHNAAMADFHTEALLQLKIGLRSRGLLPDRIIDQDMVMPSLLSLARLLAITDGGDDYEVEYERATKEYQSNFEMLCGMPLWTDDDQDEIRDDNEIQLARIPPLSRGL
jgi:hypothetical protein